MSFRAMVLRRSCLAVLFLGLTVSNAAFGQAPNSPVAFANQDAITTTFLAAPNLASSAGGAPGTGSNTWMKVEVHFGTTKYLTTRYLDAVDVKVWIEARDMDKKNSGGTNGIAVILTGSVTYLNIAPSADVYGVFYVHPSTLARYSESGQDDFDRKYDIHAELQVGGAVMDAINKNKEKDPLGWFKNLPVIPNLVYRQDQTPFTIADPDRYPAVKLPAATQ